MFPIYIFSRFVKRNRRIWLFGPLNRAFLDNGKYLFLHVIERHPEIRAYFVCQDKKLLADLEARNLPCLYKWSLKGIAYCLRAGYYLISAYVDDINFWTSRGACVINLWHGIPLKRIEFDITTGRLARRYQKPSLKERLFKPWLFRKPDFVISTSEEVSRLFASAFRVSRERCLPMGYPRTDIFFSDDAEVVAHIRRYEPQIVFDLYEKMLQYRHVLIYMPTWREDRRDFLKDAFPDLEALNSVLASQNALLLIKLHPNDILPGDIGDLSNIEAVDSKVDMYPLLKFTTALITDYSSIYFDYMLLRKPIILFPFDLEDYQRMRGLYFDYDDVAPGYVAKDFESLLACVSHIDDLRVEQKYYDLLNRFWKHQDGKSSERIVESIERLS